MKPYISDADFTLYQGDVREVLRSLPDESVHCVVTSPPYWGLRDYGTGAWGGGDAECDHGLAVRPKERPPETDGGCATWFSRAASNPTWQVCGKCGAHRTDNQLGLEPTPEQYLSNMVEVFREVRRALRKDGTCWLNIGDSYAGSWGNQGRREERGTQRPINGPMLQPLDERYPQKESNTGAVPPGLKPKDLCMIPARLALALQADGWYLRSQIVWSKPNPMPESVTDRPTTSHEFVYLLTRSPRYFFDQEAVRETLSDNPGGSAFYFRNGREAPRRPNMNPDRMDGGQGNLPLNIVLSRLPRHPMMDVQVLHGAALDTLVLIPSKGS